MELLIALYLLIGMVYAGTSIATLASRGGRIAYWKVPLVWLLWPFYVFVDFWIWVGKS